MGIDLQFLKNRVGTSFTYWNGDDKDFATTLAINGASGFTGYATNAGLITKRGMNFKLMGTSCMEQCLLNGRSTPTGVSWSENKVRDLGPGINQTTGIDGGWGTTGPYMLHKVGYDWGFSSVMVSNVSMVSLYWMPMVYM